MYGYVVDMLLLSLKNVWAVIRLRAMKFSIRPTF
jgi:hypothetical protein